MPEPVLLASQRPADDPSLIYRDETIAADGTYAGAEPLLHVLIIGVSEYPNGNFKPLSSTAASAKKIYDWIIEQGNTRRCAAMPQGWLCARLGTVRMLLSPSPLEPASVRTFQQQFALPAVTQLNIDAAVDKWIRDASRSEEDFTLFYYAGHGLQRDQNDQTLLLNDFAGARRFQLTTIAFPSIVNGMTPSAGDAIRAGTQFYFVDACRDTPGLINQFYNIEAGQLYPPRMDAQPVKYAAPIISAAQPGRRAQALEGDQTLFSKALLIALAGDAAQPRTLEKEITDRRRRFWHVTYSSLNVRLGSILSDLNKEYKASQDRITSGAGNDAPICYLENPPEVNFEIVVSPENAVAGAKVVLRAPTGSNICLLDPAPTSHPYCRKLSAQNCVGVAECDGFAQYTDDQVVIRPIGGRQWEATLEPLVPGANGAAANGNGGDS